MPTGVYKKSKEHIAKVVGNLRPGWNKGLITRVYSKCKTCGNEFPHFNFTKRKNPIFCSRKCIVNSTQFKKGENTGINNHTWKGDKASCIAKHDWVKRYRGMPSFCEHCKKSNLNYRSYNWANVSGKYKRELSDWIRLCVPCHRKFDKDGKHKI